MAYGLEASDAAAAAGEGAGLGAVDTLWAPQAERRAAQIAVTQATGTTVRRIAPSIEADRDADIGDSERVAGSLTLSRDAFCA